jgi:Arc/MetJ family transcription regulator
MTNLSTRDRSRRLASPGDILPVELWELIFRHIELDPELLRLARVCSTFNAVSIRLLLARHGQGQDVFDSPSLQLSVHTLPALYLSLQSFSAARVTCSLDRAKTRWNIHLLDALLTRTPNLRRLDLEFGHDLLGDRACVNSAFRDMVASVVHRTTGPVFIFLEKEIFSCWPRDVDTWDLQQSLFMSSYPGTTKTGAWVKHIRERFGRKPVPTKDTTGKILLHTGDIIDMKRLYRLRAVSIQLVEGNKDPPCALLILNPGEVDTICLGRRHGANIPAVDLGGALVHVTLPSLRRVIIRTDKANPTALRTFLANHPQVSDITYDVPEGVLTSTHKLIDPPLAHPTLALFTSATDVLGSAHLLCGLQDSPNLSEFTFSFPGGTLRPERLALLLQDLRLVAARTRGTKLTLCFWDWQYRAQCHESP